ncbi:MAG: nucleotidyltransferase family protein [Gammaproteobacteria bacterium]
MLDLTEDQLAVLRALLARRVPACEVRAFGSRVTGRARPHSDLDLVIMTRQPLSDLTRSELRADLEESDLPFRVDVTEWSELPAGLRAEISARSEVIREMSVSSQDVPVRDA